MMMKIRATISALVFGLALLFPASAQGPISSFPPGAFSSPARNGSAGTLPTFTNFASATNNSCGFVGSCQITASLTVASGFNVFAAMVDQNAAGTTAITTLTLSGGCSGSLTLQAATTSASGNGDSVALFYGTVTGGSCTVTVADTSSNGISRAGVAVGLLSNLSSTTPGTGCTGVYQPNGGSTYPCSASITVASGGFGVAAIGFSNAGPLTSSNLTIGSQSNATSNSVGIAYTSAAGAITPTFGGVGFVNGAIVSAPWR